jgi:hypothetical protein
MFRKEICWNLQLQKLVQFIISIQSFFFFQCYKKLRLRLDNHLKHIKVNHVSLYIYIYYYFVFFVSKAVAVAFSRAASCRRECNISSF